MKLKIQKIFSSALLIVAIQFAQAQNYIGVINSNYSGIMGADLQPASIVDSRFAVDVNLFSLNVDGWQNAKYFDADILPKRSWLYSLRRDTTWMEDSLLYQNSFSDITDYTSPDAKPRGAYIGLQFDIMNFMFHIRRDIAVGFFSEI